EVYYKNDLLIKQPSTEFQEASQNFVLQSNLPNPSEKSWRNTINLLESTAQFAVAGMIHCWLMDATNPNVCVQYVAIYPNSDKEVVQNYLQALALLQDDNKKEAIQYFDKTIDRFSKHSFAFERRGYTNYLLGNDDAALDDFCKAIAFNNELPEAHVGKAMILLRRGEKQEAIAEIMQAIQATIPQDWVYWRARLIKADCNMMDGNYADAVADLKYFTKRKFAAHDPNNEWRKYAFYKHAVALMHLHDYTNAELAINSCLEIEKGRGDIPTLDVLQNMRIEIAAQPKKVVKTATNKKTMQPV
nr:hypothetical protein [Saprospiraceae bacterium]